MSNTVILDNKLGALYKAGLRLEKNLVPLGLGVGQRAPECLRAEVADEHRTA